jgi:polyisoprenoid-binding protein YceI
MAQLSDELVGEWEFDPDHTRIGFSARHAMVTKVRGAFNEVEGRMHVDPAGPSRSSVRVVLKAASIDTRNPQRDAHLRSADFFDVESYPEIIFESTMIDEVEERMYMVIGTLTIRGISREVAIPIERRGIERGAAGELRAGFEGTRRVDRREWGLEWQVALDAGGVLVSERVTMEFEISAVKVPDAPAVEPSAPAAEPAAVTAPAEVAGPRPAGAAESNGVPSAALAERQRGAGRHRADTGWLTRIWGSGPRA